MNKQFISRPLVIISAAFAVSAAVFVLLPEYAVYYALACVVCAAVSLLPGRLRSRRTLLAACGAIIGLLWSAAYEPVTLWLAARIAESAPGEYTLLRLPGVLAELIGESIDKVFSERAAPFIRAITVGDAQALKMDSATYTTLTISGIAHIVAVSGMHVSFLVSMITPLLRGRRRRAAVALPVLVLFMAMTGFSPSVTRAVIMQSFVIIAPLVKRRSDGLTSVFAALLLILLFDPYLIAGVGLQLSFLSTLGLVLFTPKLNSMFTSFADKRPALHRRGLRRTVYKFVTSSVAASLGAIVFSTPLVAYYFGYVSIFAPLTNLLTLWAAAFCFCGGLIAALLGLVSTGVGAAAAAVATIPCDWILFIARTISRIPFAAVYVSNPYILGWLVYVYAAVTALLALRGKLRAVVFTVSGAVVTLCAALLLTALSPAGGLTLTILDVGQGQSIVVTDSGASAVIDCGGTYSSGAAVAAASHLQGEAISPVDLLILTHFHADHAGGVPELLARESFRKLVIPQPVGENELADRIIALANERGIDIITVGEKMTFSFGASVLTVYPPFGDADDNEACLTVLVSDGDWDALITGDMPAGTELLLLEHAALPDIEMFIAGHHGSRYSSSSDLLEEVLPELVIISVGADNSYGHPSEEALSRFEEVGAEVFRTDISGSITVKSR